MPPRSFHAFSRLNLRCRSRARGSALSGSRLGRWLVQRRHNQAFAACPWLHNVHATNRCLAILLPQVPCVCSMICCPAPLSYSAPLVLQSLPALRFPRSRRPVSLDKICVRVCSTVWCSAPHPAPILFQSPPPLGSIAPGPVRLLGAAAPGGRGGAGELRGAHAGGEPGAAQHARQRRGGYGRGGVVRPAEQQHARRAVPGASPQHKYAGGETSVVMTPTSKLENFWFLRLIWRIVEPYSPTRGGPPLLLGRGFSTRIAPRAL